MLVRPQQCLLVRPHQKPILSLVCIYVGWHESGMLAGTSAAMLVGTSVPETYSKFGLHFRRLARVRHACWYVRSKCLLVRPHQKPILSLVCIYIGWHESGILAGTSAAMLVGTCWKKILSAFLLPSALLGTENFFPFYVLTCFGKKN